MQLRYFPKQKGGRLKNVATFCNACDAMILGDAVWNINSTLQYGEDAADESYILSDLIMKPVVMKLMKSGRPAIQEERIQRLFRIKPHPNIVQGICTFSCKDNPIRWRRRIQAPQPICMSNDIDTTIVVQEFIERGSISNLGKSWPLELWVSITQQLCFAAMEWYDTFGFLYGDWHSGNILLDDTDDTLLIYKAFDIKWTVKNSTGVRPVLTDFSRSELRPNGDIAPWLLGTQLGYIWDMMYHECPNPELLKETQRMSIQIGEAEDIKTIITIIRSWLHACQNNIR